MPLQHYFGFPNNMILEGGLLTPMDPPEISGQPIGYPALHIMPSDCQSGEGLTKSSHAAS